MNGVLQLRASRLAQLGSWLRNEEKVYARWLGKMSVCVAWLGLLLAVVIPPHGNGLVVCLMRGCTGISCPGCGLTRSMSCALRGMFYESWHYHPMGLLILVLFAVTALSSLLPARVRRSMAAFMKSRALVFNSAYLAFCAAFVSFGAARALLEIAHLHL